MPTGWRPADVADKFPVYKIEDVYHFEKYETGHSKILLAWSWIQMISTLLLISYCFGNIATIGSPGIFIYGGFIFLQVYAFTDLMDRNRYAWVWESLKCILGFSILIRTGDWFGMHQFVSGASYMMATYLLLSLMASIYLSFTENLETEK